MHNRRWPRTTAARAVLLFPRARGRRVRHVARLRDYSARGLGVTSPAPLTEGSQFVVRLVDEEGRKLPLVFTVVHCTPARGGKWRVGAELAVGITEPADVVPEAEAPSAARVEAPAPTTLNGHTICKWERDLDVRVEGPRVWLCPRPPGREAGWGVFVDRDALDAALGHLPQARK
ncbi:MAG TPA: PilZ domain-containing protein [Tepidisphaeraceae bacterium]|nr:PilZ domain-containing protein [Tepidisphaeraceae bacterium]